MGVALSIVMVIYNAARPHMTELGSIDDGSIYRNISRFPDAVVRADTLIYRFDAPLFFANKDYFIQRLYSWIRLRDVSQLRYVLLEAESINSVDESGLMALEQLRTDLADQGIHFCLVNAIGPVRDAMCAYGLRDMVTETTMFSSLPDAIRFIDGKGLEHANVAIQSNV